MMYPPIYIWIKMNIFVDFCQFRNLTPTTKSITNITTIMPTSIEIE